MRTSDWSSDVCSSDLLADTLGATRRIYALVNEPVPVTNGPGVPRRHRPRLPEGRAGVDPGRGDLAPRRRQRAGAAPRPRPPAGGAYHRGDCSPSLHHPRRSEEHTSELQSLMRISYAVFCLKQKNTLTQESIYRTL